MKNNPTAGRPQICSTEPTVSSADFTKEQSIGACWDEIRQSIEKTIIFAGTSEEADHKSS
ncbi:hypothetical protein QO002_001202 [Pararhizobium capsulatum DSM 1112]|uniref:Uncharacterized protein n=1 Tax=Pararhizobium capsulatum DSM 1112 TaxID=1121113 RepID=A0ABU0BLD8_9HYPH|nr:hypothetical protein [Pararhizobium capsulatum DSM 1112]